MVTDNQITELRLKRAIIFVPHNMLRNINQLLKLEQSIVFVARNRDDFN
jgi:hypothetical protein